MTESSPLTTLEITGTTNINLGQYEEQQQQDENQKRNNPQETASEILESSNLTQNTQKSNEKIVLRRSTRKRKRPRPFFDELAGEQGNVQRSFSISSIR
jgi:hypothetical protein